MTLTQGGLPSHPGMLLLDALTAAVARQLTDIRGTQRSLTVDVEAMHDLYYQMASYEGPAVLIEVPGAAVRDCGVSTFDQAWLIELGFTPPEDGLPNWWIGMEQGRDQEIASAARAVVRALVEVLQADPYALAVTLGMERPHATRTPVGEDPLIAELLTLHPEFSDAVIEDNAMVIYPPQPNTAVVIHGDGLLYEVLHLGPPYDDGTTHWDDSELSLYLKSRGSGTSFTMFPDPPAIASRLISALDLQRSRPNVWAPNPFKRPRI